ncbi:MAG: hypothetical protein AB1665_03355 [Candidatus Thermoplasmatota archaeon]
MEISTAEVFLRVALMGFSLLLFVTCTISYIRVRHQRLLLISIAFALFFVKGMLLTLAILIAQIDLLFGAGTYVILLDFLILITIYLGIAKR